MSNTNSKHAVIMAGGAGTRFWPASRRERPKQLLQLWGRPMIGRAVDSLAAVVPASEQWIVTAEHLVAPIAEAVPEVPREHIVPEPVGRNTAPCVGLAAMMLDALYGDTVFGVFPADHYITDEDTWHTDLRAAYEEARGGAIVTLGVPPTRPETGYGYIHCAEGTDARKARLRHEAIDVDRFVEKPDRATAARYLESGNYLWNAGIFIVKTSTMLAEIQRQMPELAEGLDTLRRAWGEGRDAFERALRETYPTLPSTSIDYGVMENAEHVRVIPASFGWSDVGHWGALDETLPTDDDNNVTLGRVLQIDAHDTIAVSTTTVPGGEDALEERLVVALGTEGMVIVDTPDAVLVCPRSRVQQVRDVVAMLEERGESDLL